MSDQADPDRGPGTTEHGDDLRVALASIVTREEVATVLSDQCRAVVAELADLVAVHRILPPADPTALLLDAAIRHARADIEWIDHCERLLTSRGDSR